MTEVDARGLKCPLPVLKARKIMKTTASGAEFSVLADDAAAPGDFAAFCETTGARLVSDAALPDGGWRFVIAAP
ncbi:MAG: sulfurtransferase TusA family protein [Pseudomonadota bacterium]